MNRTTLIAQRIATLPDNQVVMLAGTLERFLAPVLLILIELYQGKIVSIKDFIDAFRFHFMAFGFPLQSVYSS